MDNLQNRYEEIEAFLQGIHENAVQFESELLVNEELRQEVEIHRMLATTLKSKEKNQLRATLSAVSKDFKESNNLEITHRAATVKPLFEYKKYTLRIAAGLAAVLGGFWFFNQINPNKIEVATLPPVSNSTEIQTPIPENNTINSENATVGKRNENYVALPKAKQTLPKESNEVKSETGTKIENPVSAYFELANVDFQKSIKIEADGRVKLDIYAEIKQKTSNTNKDFQFELVEKTATNSIAFSKSVQSIEEKPLGFATNKPPVQSIGLETKTTLKAGLYEIKVKDKNGTSVILGEIMISE
jgi:hypothetical protein